MLVISEIRGFFSFNIEVPASAINRQEGGVRNENSVAEIITWKCSSLYLAFLLFSNHGLPGNCQGLGYFVH